MRIKTTSFTYQRPMIFCQNSAPKYGLTGANHPFMLYWWINYERFVRIKDAISCQNQFKRESAMTHSTRHQDEGAAATRPRISGVKKKSLSLTEKSLNTIEELKAETDAATATEIV